MRAKYELFFWIGLVCTKIQTKIIVFRPLGIF
jgi:hypothetical protein